MFITNGKTLFGNTGLCISILILFVLLYLSYNKCYVNMSRTTNINNLYENFEDPSDVILKTPPPKDVRIIIQGGELLLNFSIDNSPSNRLPESFIVVLAQYDSNKKNTGNNKFYVSKEYVINPNIKSFSSGATLSLTSINPSATESASSILANSQNNVCVLNSGIPVCQYKYSNLDIRDTSGNLYYYKLGVCSVYTDLNSEYVTPYNVNSIDKLFTLETSTEQQSQQYANFLQYQQAQKQANSGSTLYSDTMSTADGQYELIKSQLGNYPDNLLLNSQTIKTGTLTDIVDKSMAQGIINVNITS